MFIYLKRKNEKNYIPKILNMVILACGIIDNFKIFSPRFFQISFNAYTLLFEIRKTFQRIKSYIKNILSAFIFNLKIRAVSSYLKF